MRLVCFAAAVLGVTVTGFARDLEIIAHRGASYDAPENTLASVNLAWQQQADAVEIDIYLSSDGRIVAIHDKTPKRYGGPDTPVGEMSFDELRALDVGNWKDPRWKGERVPLLSEILPTIPNGKRLFIEIKCGPEVLPKLKTVLEQAGRPPEQTAIIGFSETTMGAAQREFPNIEVYWIVGMKQNKQTGRWAPTAEEIIRTAKRIRVRGIDLGGTAAIDEAFAGKLQASGLPWYVWTINDVNEARRLQQLGVHGITTDRPALLLTLQSGGESPTPSR